MLKLKLSVLTLLISALSTSLFAQTKHLDIGIRLQKTAHMYMENGLSAQYSNDSLAKGRLFFGFTYVSSRFGSAIGSNALKQDNIMLNASWVGRPQKMIRPLVRLNIGYFHANYESDIFNNLTNSSAIVSPEFGFMFETKSPLKFVTTFGYNAITGTGDKGAGTLLPLFYQITASWDFLKK